jgi:predicted GTPase
MITARARVLLVLIAVPTIVFAAVGGYAIWTNGRLGWVWWLMTACGLAAWVVARFWRRPPGRQRADYYLNASPHWTPRDQQASQVVRDYQLKVDSFSSMQLADPQFYLEQVQALAADLARVYHPNARDPVANLTVPELLAAMRLAVDDMERWMLESVPGSRMLTIRHWRMLRSAPTWMGRLSETAWGASILLNPVNIIRYLTSKWSWDSVSAQLQSEILAIVYVQFMRQTGTYLIEMNSGRLRGGADAYRAAFTSRANDQAGGDAAAPITLTLVGQSGAGKTSLINLLTGANQLQRDVLPETEEVMRYRWSTGEPACNLTLLDTPGYGEAGISRSQERQIRRALEESDAALLVMDAHSPAREADRRLLAELRDYFQSKPQLRPPPVIGVLTHVDLLSPPLEWSPPYDWRAPKGAKARSIHDCVEFVSDLFNGSLAAIVPVCSDTLAGRAWGVTEELLPAIIGSLDDARAAALLKSFESQLNRDRWRILARQLKQGGRSLLDSLLDRVTQGSPHDVR